LLQVIFWHDHQQLLMDGGGELFCNDGAGNPLQALLEGALGLQAN
jgi:hypothetical protein